MPVEITVDARTDRRTDKLTRFTILEGGMPSVDELNCGIKCCRREHLPPRSLDRAYLDLPVAGGGEGSGGCWRRRQLSLDGTEHTGWRLWVTDHVNYNSVCDGGLRIYKCRLTITVIVDVPNSGSDLPLTTQTRVASTITIAALRVISVSQSRLTIYELPSLD